MILQLYNGKKHPTQGELGCIYTGGPMFEIEDVTVIYGSIVRITTSNRKGGHLHIDEDGFIHYDGVYYGDWCVVPELATDPITLEYINVIGIVPFSQDKADRPDFKQISLNDAYEKARESDMFVWGNGKEPHRYLVRTSAWKPFHPRPWDGTEIDFKRWLGEYVVTYEHEIAQANMFLVGWIDGGDMYLDILKSFESFQTAVETARLYDAEFVYDCEDETTIYMPVGSFKHQEFYETELFNGQLIVKNE